MLLRTAEQAAHLVLPNRNPQWFAALLPQLASKSTKQMLSTPSQW